MPVYEVIAEACEVQKYRVIADSPHGAFVATLKAHPKFWARSVRVAAPPGCEVYLGKLQTNVDLAARSTVEREYRVIETRLEVTAALVSAHSPADALREVQNGEHVMKEHSSERVAISVFEESAHRSAPARDEP